MLEPIFPDPPLHFGEYQRPLTSTQSKVNSLGFMYFTLPHQTWTKLNIMDTNSGNINAVKVVNDNGDLYLISLTKGDSLSKHGKSEYFWRVVRNALEGKSTDNYTPTDLE